MNEPHKYTTYDLKLYTAVIMDAPDIRFRFAGYLAIFDIQ